MFWFLPISEYFDRFILKNEKFKEKLLELFF